MNKNYDEKGNASHYSDNRINVIRMLEKIWGTEATIKFCEMNAFKYRMRLGKKDDVNQELIKANWYDKMAKFLQMRSDDSRAFYETGLPNHDAGMYGGFDEFLTQK
ncbi:MAG: DUF3310 domain-containing protein [Fusobacteriaceae bacterium]